MNTNETLIDVKKLSIQLLQNESDAIENKLLIDQIHNYFKEVTQISGFNNEVQDMISLPARKGMALSINHAAQCLLDYKRTVKFLKGFVAAIKDKQKEFPNETIQIFYAGCGPYAPFITLVAPLFSPKEIQFSLLEINKNSLEKAEVLIEQLHLTNYVTACYLSDATTFKLKNANHYHILFTETLDALLYKECYVPILWNLLPQFSSKITVIPENVTVDVYFKEDEREIFETTIFDVRKRLRYLLPFSQLPSHFKTSKVSLTDKDNFHSMLLTTEVQVYKNFSLERNESSLSLSLEMEIKKPIEHKSILFTYHTTPNMELKYTLER